MGKIFASVIRFNLKLLPLVMPLFLLAIPALAASPALGSEPNISIKNMRISVWPEYDNPRILVIYTGEFSQGSAFPQQVRFLAPAGAEISQVCALKQPGDEHLCQLYQSTADGNYLAIDYSLPVPTFYLEYYFDGIKGLPDKAFTYEFESRYPIDKLEIEIQQPLRSSDFRVAPGSQRVATGDQGFKYHYYNYDNVAQGTPISFKGNYNKADSKPSVTNKQGASQSTGSAAFPIIFGITGMAALGFTGWLLLRRPRRLVPKTVPGSINRSVPRPPPRKSRPSAANPGQGVSFCSNCGLKLQEGGNFCARCGARIKRAG